MDRNDIVKLLDSRAKRRTWPVVEPTPDDWDFMRQKFGCDFSSDYKNLMSAVCLFWVGLELYSPTREPVPDPQYLNENSLALLEKHGVALPCSDRTESTVAQIFDVMRESDEQWRTDMVPIASLGNGDMMFLRVADPMAEEVYYFDHEDSSYSLLYARFAEWIAVLHEWIG